MGILDFKRWRCEAVTFRLSIAECVTLARLLERYADQIGTDSLYAEQRAKVMEVADMVRQDT